MTTLHKELLIQSRDALENHTGNYKLSDTEAEAHKAVVAALQSAIDAPDVAVLYGWTYMGTRWIERGPSAQKIAEENASELGPEFKAFPLYVLSAPAKPLTDEQILTEETHRG